jgi:hypothetical protein
MNKKLEGANAVPWLKAEFPETQDLKGYCLLLFLSHLFVSSSSMAISPSRRNFRNSGVSKPAQGYLRGHGQW